MSVVRSGSDTAGSGSEAVDPVGEFGVVVYRGVGAEMGM